MVKEKNPNGGNECKWFAMEGSTLPSLGLINQDPTSANHLLGGQISSQSQACLEPLAAPQLNTGHLARMPPQSGISILIIS